jgi:hypothetical protein
MTTCEAAATTDDQISARSGGKLLLLDARSKALLRAMRNRRAADFTIIASTMVLDL